jgi:hypothetical protein
MSGPAEPAAPTPHGRRSYRVEARSSAPVDTVWSLVARAERWKEWSFLDRSELESEGTPAPDGVGAVRRFTRFGVGSREEVVAFEPSHHLGYAILSGFPVRHYRSDITLRADGADGSGTLVTWAGTFDERLPGTGRVMELVLDRMMRKFATDLTRYADGRPGPD